MSSLVAEIEKGTEIMSKPDSNHHDKFNPRELLYKPFHIGMENDPVAVIIDGANFYHFTRELDINIDFNALSMVLDANFPNLRGKYYITSEHIKKADSDRFTEGRSYLRPLLDFLRFNRYTVISRTIEISDENEKYKVDSSMDVEIVTQLFKVASWAKHIVFIGSSKKFALPLKELKEKGISITVVATTHAGNRSVADELRRIDNFVDIDDPFFSVIHSTMQKANFIPGVGIVTD
jgi:uncharacterized LabA/DUF88 family protein